MDDPTRTSETPRPAEALLVRSRGALDRDERDVKDAVLRMGSLVDGQIRAAVRALVARDAEAAEIVSRGDAEVNAGQLAVTDAVAVTIATQAPVARDLRMLLALDHVAHELERIGDHAAAIARQAVRLAAVPPFAEATRLSAMGDLAARLVAGALMALVDADDEAARVVAAEDDELDHLYREVFASVVEGMRSDPAFVETGTRLILASHWLERIGDRATNVAEDVVHLVTGRVEDLNP